MTQNDLPYEKMRLVPMDQYNDTSLLTSKHHRQLEKHIRKADSKVAAMASMLPYATDQTVYKKPNKRAIVALQNAHMRRYKELERQRLLDQTQALPVPPVPPPSHEQDQTKLPEDISSIDSLPMPTAIPERFKTKYNKLLHRLTANPGEIALTNSGELVIDGRIIRGTNYASAFRNLYVDYKHPAPGTHKLVHKLRMLGVPKDVVASKFAKSLLGQTGSGKKQTRMLRVY